jgi:hypothetical protein
VPRSWSRFFSSDAPAPSAAAVRCPAASCTAPLNGPAACSAKRPRRLPPRPLWDRPVAPACRWFVCRRCRLLCHGYAPGSACGNPLRLSLLRGALLLLFLQLRLVLPLRLSQLLLLLQLRPVL